MSSMRSSFLVRCAAAGLVVVATGLFAHAPHAPAAPDDAKPAPVAASLVTPATTPTPAQQAKLLEGQVRALGLSRAASTPQGVAPPRKPVGSPDWAVGAMPPVLDPAATAARLQAKRAAMTRPARGVAAPALQPMPWLDKWRLVPAAPAGSTPTGPTGLTPEEQAKAAQVRATRTGREVAP